MAPLKLASGCDRRCSFCAIPSFRGSFVSRRPSDVLGEARVAGRRGRPRGLPGQRELHVLRQGPRRPAAARDAAARARRRRGHRPGARLLPPARRDPARPDRGDRHDAGRGAVLRPLLPARQRRRCCAGCAASATPSRFLGLLEQVRGARAAGRRSLQRDRRLPRRDRGRPARPCATSSSPPASTSRACSATPTRTAPRPRASTASSTTTSSGRGSSTSPGWSRSSPRQRADERIGETVEVLVESVDDGDGRAVAPPTRVPRSTGRPTCCVGRPAVGDLVRPQVVDTEGVDLYAKELAVTGSLSREAARQLEPAQRPDGAAHRAGARSSRGPCCTTAATRSPGGWSPS